MKMETASTLSPDAEGVAPGAPTPADTTEIFLQLGSITRLLHDTLKQLGVMPKLQQAADGLPDARSRLNYIAEKTAQAAEKVLNSVDQAKAEHVSIADATRRMAQAITADPVKAVATGAVFNFVQDVEQRTAKIDDPPDRHHDGAGLPRPHRPGGGQGGHAGRRPRGQPGQAAGAGDPRRPGAPGQVRMLNGPVVNPEGRTDVVANQGEVDDLLASLGF
jgi:chemotaxis protein CheZ